MPIVIPLDATRSRRDAAAALRDLDRFRVARLATSSAKGKPLVIPICFACGKESIYSVIDEKPKRVAASQLRRLRNIRENPQICLLADHYDEDWSKLCYVIVEGAAKVLLTGQQHDEALRLLRRKYPQYRAMRLAEKPVIKIAPLRVITWKAE